MFNFNNETILITGGTGSFGRAALDTLLATNVNEIRIFSRDEKKQDEMRRFYNDMRIRYFIGDVRDLASIKSAMSGVDYVFQAAALKQVPTCEYFPMEAVKTNVLGTDNVLTACIETDVRKVVCLSTDKAVYPINAMGASKALMEKLLVAKSRTVSADNIVISGTRYGNVMCSRGSVIPKFIEQIKAGTPITVTDGKMTRFIMSLQEAVALVLFAFEHAENGDIFVQKAPACTLDDLIQALCELFQVPCNIEPIGPRPGEKHYEILLSREECVIAEDLGNYYKIPADSRIQEDWKFSPETAPQVTPSIEFTSDNTEKLSIEQLKEKLLGLSYIQSELSNWL